MFSEPYKRYVLGVLTLVYTLNFCDRVLLILLLEPIKAELQLSDTQLGFLTGIAFALFYATLGLVIARWADRGNRVTITSLAIGLWGLTVMGTVFVTNFVQLMFARIAAAVGEAGCMPPTYSLVGDYFPESHARPRAMAVYMLAGPLSSLVSFAAGGWLNEVVGWRMTFFLMGVPALLFAILVKWTVVEPRTLCEQSFVSRRSQKRIYEILRTSWQRRSLRHLSIALVLLYLMGYGLGPWYAAFMMRSHGMGTAELGLWLGLIFGVSGVVGILLGGYVTGRWFSNSERVQMRLSALMVALLFPGFVLFLLLPNKLDALIALTFLSAVWGFFFGPTFALMQRLVVDDMRATTLAIVMLCANLIGMGIGPQIVGILSDLLKPKWGAESLRYAMLLMSSVAIWAAYHYWQVGKTVKSDLLIVDRMQTSASRSDSSEPGADLTLAK